MNRIERKSYELEIIKKATSARNTVLLVAFN